MKLKDSKYANIKSIIFDLGGVLIDIDIPITIQAFEKLGIVGFDPADIHPHNRGVFLDLELGLITPEEFVSKLQNSTAISEEAIWDAWNKLILPFDMRRFELLEKLRANYKVYMLSNTNLPHRIEMTKRFNAISPKGLSYEDYFDQCFYSDTMHLRKPDRQIYAQVLQAAGIKGDETLFLDDNYHNLEGAEELGIQTLHINNGVTVFDVFE